MKYALGFGIALVSVVSVLAAEKYTSKYDNIDLDQVLHNDRLLRKYIDCGLDKGPCTKDAQVLKDNIIEALETNCSKCTEKQQEGIKKTLKHLVNNKKDWWKELTEKYDPQGNYRNKYKDLLDKEGVVA